MRIQVLTMLTMISATRCPLEYEAVCTTGHVSEAAQVLLQHGRRPHLLGRVAYQT